MTVMSPAARPVSTPLASTEPGPLADQVVPPKCSGLPSASRSTAVSCSFDPSRTSPGFGLTSQEATWLATACVRQAPFRQDCPAPHCASLPQAGARQTPSSQTSLGVAAVLQSAVAWQMLTQTECRQTCWPLLPVQSASVVQV